MSEQQSLNGDGTITIKTSSWNRVVRERDEAREERDKLKLLLAADSENVDAFLGVCIERDEAREEFSSIHRWIERNHADGFIDSLTYFQNLERVTDCWYDRFDKIERERDEAREECKAIAEKLDGIKRLCDKIEEKADWFREKAGQHLEERDEARKTAERYRLEANAMMLQRDEAIEKAKH